MKKKWGFLPNINRFLLHITLKKQLLIMIWVFLFLFLFTQILYTINFLILSGKNSLRSNTNLLQQVGQNIDTFCEEQNQIAISIASNDSIHSYLETDDTLKRYDLRMRISDFFSYVYSSDINILGMAIIDNQGRFYGIQDIPTYSIWNAIKEQYEQKGLSLEKDSFFDLVKTPTASYYALSRPIYYPTNLTTKIGNCLVVSSGKNLQNILNRLILTEHSMVYLVNSDNKILAAHDYELIGSTLDEYGITLHENTTEPFSETYNGTLYSIQQLNLSHSDWKLISMVPISEFVQPLIPLIWFGLILCAITILLLIYIGFSIFHSITSSINHLARQMESIGKEGRHKRITFVQENEISKISMGINRMLDEIDALNQNIFRTQSSLYEMELLKREAEFLALQNQINPHFLYNTLECIRDIALVYQANEISSIAISITKIFRYCIKAPNIVTISDEMVCIDHYINIIQIRYQNRFTIIKDVDPALMPLHMMKFLLQPIIENAIFHGLERKLGNGTLSIKGTLLPDSIISFEIKDDGIGIKAEQLKQMQDALKNNLYIDNEAHTGIGILNIHNRIKTMYGDDYGIQIESREQEGTCVFIRFPQYDPSVQGVQHFTKQ